VLLGDRSLSRYLIAFAAINVAAVLSFLYIEKPLMRAFAGNRPRHVEPTTLEQSQF
jgi:peptidoglycan/LPS O-acetylase OafA/YrhL